MIPLVPSLDKSSFWDWIDGNSKRVEIFSKILDAIILMSLEERFIAFLVYKIIPELVGSKKNFLKTWLKKRRTVSFTTVLGQELRWINIFAPRLMTSFVRFFWRFDDDAFVRFMKRLMFSLMFSFGSRYLHEESLYSLNKKSFLTVFTFSQEIFWSKLSTELMNLILIQIETRLHAIMIIL